MQSSTTTHQEDYDQTIELLYLPSIKSAEFASLGHRNVFANVLWFTTVNYFGKHFRTDKNLKWLFHLCDLITTLNPRARHVYEFGSTMLSWETREPEKAIQLLNRAVTAYPNEWRFFYLRGFTYMFFLHDHIHATADFIKASKLPGVHPTVVRLAGKKLSESDNPRLAVAFLESLLQSNSDPSFQKAVRSRLIEARRVFRFHLIKIWESVFVKSRPSLPAILQLDHVWGNQS